MLLALFLFHTQRASAVVRSVDILVTVAPEVPKPYDDVTITLQSFDTDLNKATIEWKGGETLYLKDTGATDFSFKMGGLGTQSIIDVVINTPEGDIVRKRIALTPTDVDLLWQAVDSYVPPFYKGKALPIKEGLIRVVAVPNSGATNQSGALTYTWQLNNSAASGQSGYKKNVFEFTSSKDEASDSVGVTASSTASDYLAKGRIELIPNDPLIIFYKKSPTEGTLYNNALIDQTQMVEDEMTVVAEPYFLSLKGHENSFQYTWQINGNQIETPSRKNEITIRPTDRNGYSLISLSLENMNALFQKATRQLRINL